MQRISTSITNILRQIMSWCFILCIAFSMLTGSWRGSTSLALQKLNQTSLINPAQTNGTDAPDTTASIFTFSNPAPITINDSPQLSSPYPSNIVVPGLPGTIEKVTVNVNSFSHTFPDDVDILLVSPSGRALTLMSDVGGSIDAVSLTLTFDDTAAAAVPLNGPILATSYRPTDEEAADTFPSPAPGGQFTPPPIGTATLASAFAGTIPSGTWSLYVRDDVGTDIGSIAGGWSLTITNSITAQNTQNIDIPDSGTASLYPSSLTVSGLAGSVISTTVMLNNFSHTAPDDVDLLLVAPGGRRVVLMSDVGGTVPVTNLSITIEDSASSILPDEGTLVSGSYKPTNVGSGDAFPAPAPQGAPSGTTLAALNGIAPNGTWSLYLVDDNGANTGSITGGWSIALATSTTACSLNITPPLQVFSYTGGSGNFDILPAGGGCGWTATSDVNFITINSPTSGEGNATLNFTVDVNMGQGRTGSITVSTASFTRTFNVQQASGCPFTLSQESLNFGGNGGAGNVGVTAAGMCGWISTTDDTWITINSGAGSGNGMVTFTVAPNTTANPRTGTIQIGARLLTINQARAANETPFDFDGDAKADLSVFRPANSTWYISRSSNGSLLAQQFGLATDRIVPADYDGDNKADISVFRGGTWYTLSSINGSLKSDQWGTSGDIAVPADYDGDSKADLAVWRESNSTFYILSSLTGSVRAQQFGAIGDRPVIGDFDGDFKADVAVFRPSTGTWYILRSSDSALQATQFGLSSDRAVPADYDADGKTDIAVYRASNATWYVQQSTAGFTGRQFGLSTDVPVAGDYDGDGKADLGVFREGVWHILQSTNGLTRSEQWGASGDTAVPSAFVP